MKNNVEIAHEVLEGLWGNGIDRRNRLTEAGYDYGAVQGIVNVLVADGITKPAVVENSVDNVENSVLKVDVDIAKYTEVEINIIM